MRIFTRGDLDGLACCVLLTITEDVSNIIFAHPKDIQDNIVRVTNKDIVVNLPYASGCAMWFDHHSSEDKTPENIGEFTGSFEVAPSAARVIYNYYKKEDLKKFEELIDAVDRLDSANLTIKDIVAPEGWILIGMTLDPRSGFGSEFQKYFRWLVEYVKKLPLETVLAHKEVQKRCNRVLTEQEQFTTILKQNCTLEGKVVLTDFRNQTIKDKPVGNRFLVYTLFPESLSEVRVFKGKLGITVIAVGHNIFNRSSKVHIGKLLTKFHGGGHRGAGTCQVPPSEADAIIQEIITTINNDDTSTY